MLPAGPVDADDKFARLALALPCNLDCVGALDGIAVYIGLMPDADAAPVGSDTLITSCYGRFTMRG